MFTRFLGKVDLLLFLAQEDANVVDATVANDGDDAPRDPLPVNDDRAGALAGVALRSVDVVRAGFIGMPQYRDASRAEIDQGHMAGVLADLRWALVDRQVPYPCALMGLPNRR